LGTNMHLYEKARETHYQDLRHEMENRQLLKHLRPQRSLSRRAAGKLGLLLLKLGMWLKQFEQPASARSAR
jgi:hypothetical protein